MYKTQCSNSINSLRALVKVWSNYLRTPPIHNSTTITGTNRNSNPNLIFHFHHHHHRLYPHRQLVYKRAEADDSLVRGTLATVSGLLIQNSPSDQAVILSAVSLCSRCGVRATSGGGGEREKGANEVVEMFEQLKDECYIRVNGGLWQVRRRRC